ncbi:MAG: hypothetical protein ACXVY3_11035 [Gaiellaceae bacterium]
MNAVRTTSRPQLARWTWFWAWVALGAGLTLGIVSLGPLVIVPVVVVAGLMLTRPAIRRSAYGLVSGAGVPLLYVAYVQRDGPGTTCWQRGAVSGCDQHLNPLPWLVVGIVLIVAGVVAHARQGR